MVSSIDCRRVGPVHQAMCFDLVMTLSTVYALIGTKRTRSLAKPVRLQKARTLEPSFVST